MSIHFPAARGAAAAALKELFSGEIDITATASTVDIAVSTWRAAPTTPWRWRAPCPRPTPNH